MPVLVASPSVSQCVACGAVWLPHVAACCSVHLDASVGGLANCVAVCCSVLQCVALWGSVLPRVAVCCSVHLDASVGGLANCIHKGVVPRIHVVRESAVDDTPIDVCAEIKLDHIIVLHSTCMCWRVCVCVCECVCVRERKRERRYVWRITQ